MMMDRRRLIAKAAATLALTACDKPPPSPVGLAQGVVWEASTRAFSHLDRPLDVVRSWDFASGDSDFTATEAELNHRPGRGLEVVSLSADPQLRSPAGLAVRGAAAPLVLVRLRRMVIAGPWDGALYFSTSRHGESADYMNLPLVPPAPDDEDWSILIYDMGRPARGGRDWRRSEISQIRLDLDAAPGGVTLISHIALARAL
jgi:hypothetical protein